jgi:hypothetical protein
MPLPIGNGAAAGCDLGPSSPRLTSSDAAVARISLLATPFPRVNARHADAGLSCRPMHATLQPQAPSSVLASANRRLFLESGSMIDSGSILAKDSTITTIARKVHAALRRFFPNPSKAYSKRHGCNVQAKKETLKKLYPCQGSLGSGKNCFPLRP